MLAWVTYSFSWNLYCTSYEGKDETEYNLAGFAKKKIYPAQRTPFQIDGVHNTLTLSQRRERTNGLTLVMAATGILCRVVCRRGFCGAGGTFERYCCDV